MKSVLITKRAVRIVEDTKPLSLECLYKLLECSTIDIVTRNIAGNRLQIVCDDEGLLKPNHITGSATDYKEMLFGNILVTAYDQEGEQRGLDDEEIEAVTNSIASTAGLSERMGDFVLRYKCYN